jgi:hypothetical protein
VKWDLEHGTPMKGKASAKILEYNQNPDYLRDLLL